MVNKRVINLLKKLETSRSGVAKLDELKVDYTVVQLAERCGYVINDRMNKKIEITPEGARFVVALEGREEERKKNNKLLYIQLLTAGILIITAVLSYESTDNELYLSYPHFGIYAGCLDIVPSNGGAIKTGIDNYGKYADQIKLNVSSMGNITYGVNIDNKISGNSETIRYILPAGNKLSGEIWLNPNDTTNNFTIFIQYDCEDIIKPCDFWTAKNVICEYTAGEYKQWYLVREKYEGYKLLSTIQRAPRSIFTLGGVVIILILAQYFLKK